MEGFKFFTEITKFLDRNFIVAYLAPAIIWLGLSTFILEQFGLLANISIPHNSLDDLLLVGSIILVLALLTGIVLLSLNQNIFRFLEGYGKYNPFRLVGWLERNHYRKIVSEINKLDDEIRRRNGLPSEARMQRNILMRKVAEEYPDREEFLLPTHFGNVIRSFEIYPRVMYGLEAIDGWVRLLAIVPKEYMELIDGAKSRVNFWVNLTFTLFALLIQYELLAYFSPTVTRAAGLVIGIFILASVTAIRRATQAALEWGDFMKSAFDLYRFDLLEALAIEPPRNRKDERNIWMRYSQAIIYRLPDVLPELKKTNEKLTREKPRSKKSK